MFQNVMLFFVWQLHLFFFIQNSSACTEKQRVSCHCSLVIELVWISVQAHGERVPGLHFCRW